MAFSRPFSFAAPLAALAFALALAGCAGSGANVPGLTSTPVETRAPGGPADSTEGASNCGAALANFERVIGSDVKVGHLSPSVYDRIVADLTPVKASCTAGRDAQARAQLAGVRARYGYP